MPKMINVDITQFIHPNGRQRQMTTQLPVRCLAAYGSMVLAGCRFEAEILSTGEISITISNADDDIDIEVVPNGPEVQDAMVAMLERGRWRGEMSLSA